MYRESVSPISKSPFWQLIIDGSKKWLGSGFSSSQRIESDRSTIQVNLSSDQTMRPVFIHGKSMSQKSNFSLLISPAQKNKATSRVCLEVQLPVIGKGSSCGGLFDATAQSSPVRSYVLDRLRLDRTQTVVMEALPYFGLPTAIKAFDGSLKASLLDRSKNRGDVKAEAKSHDATDRIAKLMGPLEPGVVIELSISGKPENPPMLSKCFHSASGCDGGIRPRSNQSTVEGNSIKDLYVNSAFDHQAFNHIKAVEFTSPLCYLGQIPTWRWRPMTNTATAIQSAAPFQDAANGAQGGNADNATVEQFSADHQSTILAQSTRFFKFAANCQHSFLHSRTRALNCVRDRRPIGPVHLIEGFISSPFNPPFNRSEPHTIKPCDFTPRSTLPNRRDQSPASIRHRTFLSILTPQQRFCRTLNKAITMATVPHLVTHRRSEGCDTYPLTLWVRRALLASCSTQWLGSDNLVQSFNNLSQFLWRRSGNHLPNPFDRKGTNLADFHHDFFGRPLARSASVKGKPARSD